MIVKDGGVILLPLPRLALVIAGNFSADEENADLILYLASDHAGYISGQNYVIDGCRKMI